MDTGRTAVGRVPGGRPHRIAAVAADAAWLDDELQRLGTAT
jgi:hypothetical protein